MNPQEIAEQEDCDNFLEQVFCNKIADELILEEGKLIAQQIRAFRIPFKKVADDTQALIATAPSSYFDSREQMCVNPVYKSEYKFFTYELHNLELNLKFVCLGDTDEPEIQFIICDLNVKIFITKHRLQMFDLVTNDKPCPVNYLSNYNEQLMELYESKWAISQVDISDDGDDMKHHYDMIKNLCGLLRTPKKTRRGGKRGHLR